MPVHGSDNNNNEIGDSSSSDDVSTNSFAIKIYNIQTKNFRSNGEEKKKENSII